MSEISLKYWNGFYYANVELDDGRKAFDIKSVTDMTYTAWVDRAKKILDTPEPVPVPKECTCPKCGFVFVCPNRGI